MRLVVIDSARKAYSVYEGKVCIAKFVLDNDVFLSKEDVEEMRTAVYATRA